MEYNKKDVGNIFKKIDHKKKHQIIKEVILFIPQIDIWDPVKDIKERFEVDHFDEINDFLYLKELPNQSQLAGLSIMATFEYKSLHYFLADCLVYDLSRKRYSIKTSGTLLKCDHRQDIRIPLKFLDHLELKINSQDGFSFTCFDFSAGGVAAYIESEKKDLFKKNRTFRDVTLEINNKSFQIPLCRVLYQREVDDGLSVGITFEELTLFAKKELKSLVQRIIYQVVSGK